MIVDGNCLSESVDLSNEEDGLGDGELTDEDVANDLILILVMVTVLVLPETRGIREC